MATNNAINLKNSGIASYDGAGTFSALANPLTVANGGTGAATFTAYAVLCAGTTTTNPVQSIASVGTTGQILVNNGASTLPTFKTWPGYAQRISCTSANPADAATYFLADGATTIAFTASGTAATRQYIGTAGTLNICYARFTVAGTLGSAENSTLNVRLNNTTDYAVSSTIQLTAVQVAVNNTGLAITVAAGDYIEYKLVCPTWVTNPTSVTFTATIMIK